MRIAKLRAMVDFSALANVLARAERETTLCVLQAQLAIATSRHLLARVATQRTLLSGAAPSFDVCDGDFAIAEVERLTDGHPVARALGRLADQPPPDDSGSITPRASESA